MHIYFVETNADIRFVVESNDGHVAGLTEYNFWRWEGYQELRAAYLAFRDGYLDGDGIAAAARTFWDLNCGDFFVGCELWDVCTSEEPENYPHPTLDEELDDTCSVLADWEIDLEFSYSEN